MKNIRFFCPLLVCVLMLLVLNGTIDVAAAKESTYPDKPITWLVPYGPGGGFDTIARAIAPIMAEYLPRKPHIIIRNMPGAGGRKGVTWVYKSKPDGYTFGYTNIPGQLVYSLVNKVGYDFNKVEWIGNVSSEPVVIFAATSSGINNFDELMKAKKLKFGSGGKGSGEDINARFADAVLNLKASVVTGYSGSNEVIIGLIRGDAHLIAITVSSGYQYVKSGDLKAVLVMGGSERTPVFPDTPVGAEKGYDALSAAMLYRAVYAPPGTPKDRINMLSNALSKALKDKRMIKWSEKTGRKIGPVMSSDKLKVAIGDVISSYGKYKELFK